MQLSWRRKLVHGIGAGPSGTQLAMNGLLLLYYNQVLGLPAAWVSAALGVVVLLDAWWDPAVGHFSDRLRTEWGRRHPLMYAAVLPTAALFLAVWNPPPTLSDEGLFLWLVVSVGLLRLALSFYEVPATALTPELAPHYHDRTLLIAYRWVCGAMLNASVVILAYGLFLRATPEQPMGQLNRDGYGPLSIAVAALILTCMLVAARGTQKFVPQLYRPTVEPGGLAALWRHVVATLSNRNFVVALIASGLGGLGTALVEGLSIYIATYFWELPSRNVMVLVLGGVLAAPFGAAAARRLSQGWGKKRACMTLFFASVFFGMFPMFMRLIGLWWQNGDPALVPVLTLFRFIAGICTVGGYILVSSMLADIVEEAAEKTGKRSEGLLMSADSVLQKTINAVGTILPGLLLAFIAFPEKAVPGQVPAETLAALGWSMLALTVTLNVASISVWRWYGIDEAAHEGRVQAQAAGLKPAE